MAEIRWIKLRIDMFDDEKIKIIQSMPDGDAILVIWIRIIALAGKCNAGGLILVEDEFPYTDEMLSIIFGKPLATVRLALQTFERFHMIESTEKGFYITNFDKHQNIEGLDKIREQNRIRKQRERAKKKALGLEASPSGIPSLPDAAADEKEVVTNEVTGMSRDKSREVTQQREEEEKEERNNNISISPNGNIDIVGGAPTQPQDPDDPAPEEPKRENLRYSIIKADFNGICKDLPEVKAMSDARKRAVRTLLNELESLEILPNLSPYDKLRELFRMVQESDFLTGRSGKWGKCCFDWIMNKKNALKILEGNYTDKGGAKNARAGTDEGSGNGGQSGNAGARTLEGTTLGALERFRRNAGNEEL